ncbi:oligosaccharide MFS transporter [Staphylococcus caeli]|uniref:Sucrose permease, major facilitator superfamily n=1 Tax=Staphylococcus caeli TaxID=2201815 RepID=A0A1D4NFE8_9STAP|nr:oligosaccharide MFS transporter [Staphylococcus caeli]SCT09374.1 sucrose permease, major facilitator superfamily [Staphylococcus caeli]SCT13648.1 sucrose permease, major facilitator superfamily [Staphylococcus caeli]
MRNFFSEFISNKSYFKNSITFFLFFAAWGIWWPFFQIWLSSKENGLGLPNTEIGIIYSINSVTALLFIFIYGIIQDKIGINRILLVICSIITSFTGPFFILFYEPFLNSHFYIVSIVGSVFLSSGFLAAMGLYEAVIEKFSRAFDFNYGKSRAWGSLGYAIASLISGSLYIISPSLTFGISSLFSMTLAIILIFYQPIKENKLPKQKIFTDTAIKFADLSHLFKSSKFLLFVLIIFFTCPLYLIFEQQLFPSYFLKFAPENYNGEKIYSIFTSLQVFIEVLVLMLAEKIISIIGIKKTLILSLIIMVLRIGLSILTDDFVIISVIKVIHAFEIPIFILSVFKYITMHFSTRLSATVYLIGYIMIVELGQIIFSTPIGIFQDYFSYKTTFILLFLIILSTTIGSTIALLNDKVNSPLK